jgi:hypothetical protein
MRAAREGKAWVLSTPTGTGHYFFVLFQKSRSLFSRDCFSWQPPTSANPHIRPAEIERMRQDMPEHDFTQEILGQLIAWEGTVFSRLREAIITGQPQGQAAIIGVDWAGSLGGGDYTCFCVLSLAGHVLELVRMRREFVAQQARLKGLWERHSRPYVLAEENGLGSVLNSQMRQQGLKLDDWITSNQSKKEIIGELITAFVFPPNIDSPVGYPVVLVAE